MKKKIEKKAIIRSSTSDICPYGLPITSACKCVGNLVNNMAPITILGYDSSEEEMSELAAANKHLFIWNKPDERCKYAASLFERNPNSVECNWDEFTAGQKQRGALQGSPYYYGHFQGLDGLFTMPMEQYINSPLGRMINQFSVEGIS
jgi:hypothetical protein